MAKPPSAWRSCSRPASGRRSGGRELNSLPPTAPSSTASLSSAASSVVSGSGEPCSLDGGAADQRFRELEIVAADFRDARSTCTASRCHFGADTVACHNQYLQLHHCLPAKSGDSRLPGSQLSFAAGSSLIRSFDQILVAPMVRDEVDQVLVVDGLFAIGEFGEAR